MSQREEQGHPMQTNGIKLKHTQDTVARRERGQTGPTGTDCGRKDDWNLAFRVH